jgi:acyl-ACP thioesterase
MAFQQLEKDYRVHVYESGPDGRVNIQSLFNYMQDIAAEHAKILGYGRDDLMKNNNVWVLSRMYAEIYSWPGLNERIIVKTWPAGVEKFFATRNYEIRSADGSTVASASSNWLIIDYTTKKIQRPDEFLKNFSRENSLAASPVRLPVKLMEASAEGEISSPYRVTVNDLDINLHTNNVNYLKWVTDIYDLNFVMNKRPVSAEINYLAEAVFNDEIVIRRSHDKTTEGFINHSIIRKGDNKELCRIRMGWLPEKKKQNQFGSGK